jgi:endonuclease YncB( thermonuclease family)
MAKVVPFKKPPPFRGSRPRKPWRVPPLAIPGMLIIGGIVGLVMMDVAPTAAPGGPDISCFAPRIIDGDTLDCGGERVRLSGIDAPEMPGHCRPGRDCVAGDPFAARRYLQTLTRGRVDCTVRGTGYYGRAIARCQSRNRDLSCAMLSAGHAASAYGGVSC